MCGIIKWGALRPLCKVTILGKIFCAFLCKILLDKMAGMWYNGNFGPDVRARAASIAHYEDFVNRQFIQKISPQNLG